MFGLSQKIRFVNSSWFHVESTIWIILRLYVHTVMFMGGHKDLPFKGLKYFIYYSDDSYDDEDLFGPQKELVKLAQKGLETGFTGFS